MWIARLISSSFAAASMLGVYLLARRMRGPRTALIASSLLGLAPLFCRVSHEVLLDNALTALSSFALWFLWEGWSSPARGRKRAAALAAGFTVGLTFLIKGLVGPALIGSGILIYTALDRRWKDLFSESSLWFIIAFLVPALIWLIPFYRNAGPGLLETLFIHNHWARFTQAYEGHGRPIYFYLMTLGYKLGWASIFLPLAAFELWKYRKLPAWGPDLFSFSFAAGPLLLLSLSRAKEAIYLLPAYPALALWAASWIDRTLEKGGSAGRRTLFLLNAGALLSAMFMAGWSWFLGGPGLVVLFAFVILGLGVLWLSRRVKRWESAEVLGPSLLLWGLACFLAVSGPAAAWDDGRQEWPPVKDRILSEAGGAEIFLLGPTDELRGALGFYRRRTARECQSVQEFREHLAGTPGSLGVLFADSPLHRVLLESTEGVEPEFLERFRMPFRDKTILVIESPASGSR